MENLISYLANTTTIPKLLPPLLWVDNFITKSSIFLISL